MSINIFKNLTALIYITCVWVLVQVWSFYSLLSKISLVFLKILKLLFLSILPPHIVGLSHSTIRTSPWVLFFIICNILLSPNIYLLFYHMFVNVFTFIIYDRADRIVRFFFLYSFFFWVLELLVVVQFCFVLKSRNVFSICLLNTP